MPSVAGIASGIDTNAIVKQLLAAASGPIKGLQRKISDHTYRRTQLEQLNTLLTTFKTSLAEADGIAELPSFSASSSDGDSVFATVSGDASPGTYSISVDQKAQSSQQQSASYAAISDTLKDGTLTVTVGSTVTNVTIDSATGTNTVQGIADYLTNNVVGVNAYVLDTGAASDPYKIIVTGTETGLDNAVALSVNQTGLTGEDLSFSSSRTAQDAQITVDSNTVTRSTNSIDDAVPGLSMTLFAVTTGTVDVTVSRDTAAMADKVSSIVSNYNNLNAFFKKHSGPDADPVIASDQTLRTIHRHMQSIVSAGYSTDNVAGLNTVGIGSDQYGDLEFTSSDFTSMLSTNWEDVLGMLTGTEGLFGALYAQVDADIDPTDGLIQPRIDSIDDRVNELTDSIADAERRLVMYEETLKAQFIAMETALAKYQATQSYLDAQMAQLTKKK